eukprot:tig00000093_g3617.t2
MQPTAAVPLATYQAFLQLIRHTPTPAAQATAAVPQHTRKPISLNSKVKRETRDCEGAAAPAPFRIASFPWSINVLACVDLKCEVDLRTVAMKGPNVEYAYKLKSAHVTMRHRRPEATCLVYQTGKATCAGAKTEADAKAALLRTARVLRRLGFPVKFAGFRVTTVNGSCEVGFPVRLEKLARSRQHFKYTSYEPELAAHLTYHMEEPRVVLLVQRSGKIKITGARSRAEVHEAFARIHPVLCEFRKS